MCADKSLSSLSNSNFKVYFLLNNKKKEHIIIKKFDTINEYVVEG